MKQSIETIWKKGFIKNDVLIAPKINHLYDKKSQNIVDKFYKMFEINRKAIIAGAIVILLVLSFIGAPFLGIFVFASLFVLLHVGKQGMEKLNQLDKNTSSYHYLKSFVKWKKDVVAVYEKTYSYFYPILFLATALRFRFSEDGRSIINQIVANLPDSFMIFGIPGFLLASILIVAGLLAYFAAPIYRKDLDLVYGSTFRKLDELVAEMEDLRR